MVIDDHGSDATGVPLPQPDMLAGADRMIDAHNLMEGTGILLGVVTPVRVDGLDGFRLEILREQNSPVVIEATVTGSRDLVSTPPCLEDATTALQLMGTLLSMIDAPVRLDAPITIDEASLANTAPPDSLETRQAEHRKRRSDWLDRHLTGIAGVARDEGVSAHIEPHHRQGTATLLCDFSSDIGDSWDVLVEVGARPSFDHLTAEVSDEYEAFNLLAEVLARACVPTWLHY